MRSPSSPARAPVGPPLRLGTWLRSAMLIATAAVLVWLAPRGARACSCIMPPPPADALAEADAVFEARAFSLTTDDRRARYRFEVDRVWKGQVGPRVEIATALNSAACGRTYKIGTQYVIYARRGPGGGWVDGLCSRTRASVGAGEDLQVLGEGHRPVEPTDTTPSEPDGRPTEPPRIDTPPAEPPPTSPSRRGCSVENAHRPGFFGLLMLMGGLTVAAGRRRTVRSAKPRGTHRTR